MQEGLDPIDDNIIHNTSYLIKVCAHDDVSINGTLRNRIYHTFWKMSVLMSPGTRKSGDLTSHESGKITNILYPGAVPDNGIH